MKVSQRSPLSSSKSRTVIYNLNEGRRDWQHKEHGRRNVEIVPTCKIHLFIFFKLQLMFSKFTYKFTFNLFHGKSSLTEVSDSRHHDQNIKAMYNLKKL